MKAIGLDIGTTSICGILMDCESGEVLQSVSRENRFLEADNDFERLQAPEEILEKLLAILHDLGTDGVSAIGVTGQMHGILYVDAHGQAVSPLYTWQDGRGQQIYRDGKTYAETLGSHTGYGNVTHFYNRENRLVPAEAVALCTIHDYAVMRLTGRTAPLLHISDAASLGCFDLHTKQFTVKDALLPPVTEKTEIAGTYRGIPVSVAIGDNQASFIGCGCRENDLLINIGTGAQVSMITDSAVAPVGIEVRPLTEGKNIFVGSSLCGGRAYAILEGFFRQVVLMAGGEDRRLYDDMERAARETGTTTLRFETLFSGTRAEPDRRASITSLEAQSFTPGDLVLGCLHGMLDELYALYEQCGAKASRIIASGNGIRKNPLLCELIEQQYGMPLCLPAHREEAAYGAALLALTACGACRTWQDAQRLIRAVPQEHGPHEKAP